MGSWKENKMVGIIAVVVALIVIGLAIKMFSGKDKMGKEDMEEIEKINAMAEQEIKKMQQE